MESIRLKWHRSKDEPKKGVTILSDYYKRMMWWIETEGGVPYEDPETKERLKEYLCPVWSVFPDLVSMVSAVYVYRMDQQSGSAAGPDGISWENHTLDVGILYAVGISLEAMDKGPEYTQFLFLHELTHIITGHNHDHAFHGQLNKLLSIFNKATGSNLFNDMLGMPMRYDFRPYMLPDNIPIQNDYIGKQFHTEAKE